MLVTFQVGDLSNPELRIFTEQLDKIKYGGEINSNLIHSAGLEFLHEIEFPRVPPRYTGCVSNVSLIEYI